MDEVKEYTFEELCQIVGAIAAEYGILKVYLFGSRSRGDNRPDSDYEFCIVAPKGMGLFKMGGFYGKLEEALGTEIDIVRRYATSSGISVEEAFKRALFEKIEDEYDTAVGEAAYRRYLDDPSVHSHEEVLRMFDDER